MTVEIVVGGWEHECCGPEIRLNDIVRWDVRAGADGVRHATHHQVEDVSGTVRGRVAELALLDQATGGRIPIDRVPSGGALVGNQAADDPMVTRLDTGETVRLSGAAQFLVCVQPG
ncbi:MAG: hypothetical protein QM582_10660 [Micropruina sp.]|uniref:DUF6578 domain-containing protein n=1 Tax=Micropruina sp. TaxID=2737536 RepID=UPI0039E44A9A